jgi:hypothetical protein
MALLASGGVSAAAVIAAGNVVKARWRALDRVLSAAEVEQMRQEVLEAEHNALFAHISANAAIAGAAGVGLVAPPGGGPVTGSVILLPGSIT